MSIEEAINAGLKFVVSNKKEYQKAAKEQGLTGAKKHTVQLKSNLFTGQLKGDIAEMEIIYPLTDGSALIRITAKTHGDEAIALKAHIKANIEIRLAENEVVDFFQKDEITKGLVGLKLNQYTGYIAEQHIHTILKEPGGLLNKMFMRTDDKVVASSFGDYLRELKGLPKDKDVEVVQGFSIQNQSGQGIDFLIELKPSPPPPKYVTIDSKATLTDTVGAYDTPNTPAPSKAQLDYSKNVKKHLMRSVNSYISKEDKYDLADINKAAEYQDILDYLDKNPSELKGFIAQVGLKEGYELLSNKKYKTLVAIGEI